MGEKTDPYPVQGKSNYNSRNAVKSAEKKEYQEAEEERLKNKLLIVIFAGLV